MKLVFYFTLLFSSLVSANNPFFFGLNQVYGPRLILSSTCSAAGGTSFTCSVSPAAGDMIVLAMSVQFPGIGIGVSDDKSNTWVQDLSYDASSSDYIFFYRVQSAAAGATTITITNNFSSVAVYALIVRGTTGTLDKTQTNPISNSTTFSTGTTSTLAQASEFAIGICNRDITEVSGPTNGFTGKPAFSSGGTVQTVHLGYLTTTSTSGKSTGWTVSSASFASCGIVTYK